MERRIWFVLAFVFTVVLIVSPVSAQTGFLASQSCAVEQFADLFFPQAMEDLNVPGAVFVLVHDGEIVCSVGYGHANVELQTPVDPENSLFRVASVAKLMTATGVLTLMDQGKVDVGDNANSHLGRIELPQYKDSPITIADLLTHTEGFEQNSVGGKTLDPEQLLTLEEFLLFRRPQVYRAPGEMVTYGNHASAVLGLLIEDVSEESYADYIGKQLFEPILMSSSTFAQPLPLDLQERRVQEYRFENGAYRSIDPSYSHMVSAGGMHATAHDLALYLAMIQNGGLVNGEQILSPEAIELITNTQYSPHRGLPGLTFGFLEHSENQKRILYRDGDSEGAKSRVVFLPDENLGWVLLYNSNSDKFREILLRNFLQYFFPADIEYFEETRLSAEELSEFTGTYNYSQYSRNAFTKLMKLATSVTVEVDRDSLVVSPFMEEPFGNLQTPTTFVHLGEDLFRGLEREIYIAFGRDDDGKVNYLYSGSGYHGSYQRVGWYDLPQVHLGLFVLFGLIFGMTLLVWFVRMIRRRFMRAEFPRVKQAKWVERLSMVCSGLNLLFLVLLIPALFLVGMKPGLPAFAQGVTGFMVAVLSIPVVNIVPTVMLLVVLSRHWTGIVGLGWAKYVYLVGCFAAIFFWPFLLYWRLLGLWLQ